MSESVIERVKESYESEKEIIEWIFELGDFDYLRKSDVVEYIKKRYNSGLVSCGFDSFFDVDQSAIDRTEWFDLQINSTTHTDFFNKRSVNYTKGAQSYTANDLF